MSMQYPMLGFLVVSNVRNHRQEDGRALDVIDGQAVQIGELCAVDNDAHAPVFGGDVDGIHGITSCVNLSDHTTSVHHAQAFQQATVQT